MRGGDTLAELRAWRDKFARSHGYDLGAMVAALREMDVAAGARVVRGEPPPPCCAAGGVESAGPAAAADRGRMTPSAVYYLSAAPAAERVVRQMYRSGRD